MPAQRPRSTGRRPVFRLRITGVWFALVAAIVCGAGLTLRVLGAAAAEHPLVAGAVGVACLPAGAGLIRTRRRLRLRRAATRAARALEDAAEAVVETVATVEEERAAAPEAEEVDYESLDADAFEQAVADLCERDGCRGVQVVGGAGDLGADVVATSPDGRRLVIQCKRYADSHKVGSQDVQRFGGTCYAVHEAELAAVVTTSDFTQPAAEYAEQCGILCFDREALAAWSAGTGPAPWVRDPGSAPVGSGLVP